MNQHDLAATEATCDYLDHSYPLPQGWPTQEQQSAYWDEQEQGERTGGMNDHIEEQEQFSNYEEHQQ
jgi:hypothetical protein